MSVRLPLLEVVGAAILEGDACLVAQRGPSAVREALKWEFPGGKVESGETRRSALAREIHEELGVEIEVGDRLGRGQVDDDGGVRIELEVYAARIVSGEIRLVEHHQCGWFRAEEIDGLDWAVADRPVLAALKRRLSA